MTRGLHADFLAERQSVNPAPLVLVEIETGDGGTPWLRFTQNQPDGTWPDPGGNLYTARPFQFSQFAVEGGSTPGIEVQFPDVDLFFDNWLSSSTFLWKKLIRKQVERGELGSGDKVQIDQWRITKKSRSDQLFTFIAEPLLSILQGITIPREGLTREDFPGLPRAGVLQQ